ncbi:MAG: DUF481 domain-containing protein [Treponema sp.]|nr:DUF481 domain-containing protein [Treponema sp.]
MKKLFVVLILALLPALSCFAQFDLGIGSDLAIRTGASENTLMSLNLGGYMYPQDRWYGFYRPASVSYGSTDIKNNYQLLANFGLGFGTRLEVNEESSFRFGIAPVFSYDRIKNTSVSSEAVSTVWLGFSLDAHYQYEPFADEQVSLALCIGTRFQYSPFRLYTQDADLAGNQLLLIKPYAGITITFDTSIDRYTMNGPGL